MLSMIRMRGQGLLARTGTSLELEIERLWMLGSGIGMTSGEMVHLRSMPGLRELLWRTFCNLLEEHSKVVSRAVEDMWFQQLLVGGGQAAKTARMLEEIEGYHFRRQQINET